jgi:hypothetical protein
VDQIVPPWVWIGESAQLTSRFRGHAGLGKQS